MKTCVGAGRSHEAILGHLVAAEIYVRRGLSLAQAGVVVDKILDSYHVEIHWALNVKLMFYIVL